MTISLKKGEDCCDKSPDSRSSRYSKEFGPNCGVRLPMAAEFFWLANHFYPSLAEPRGSFEWFANHEAEIYQLCGNLSLIKRADHYNSKPNLAYRLLAELNYEVTSQVCPIQPF